mgnify:CR=1 FL=1|tara:strand:+ start:11904 stop:12089 length:186 start_codon:yes stop_codon:yes gene_type:complete
MSKNLNPKSGGSYINEGGKLERKEGTEMHANAGPRNSKGQRLDRPKTKAKKPPQTPANQTS